VGWERTRVDRSIARANINQFRDRLRSETDAALRAQLLRCLVEEEDTLAADLALLNDLAREILKYQQWIERQRLRIQDLERDGHDSTAAIALLNCVTETLIVHQEYRQRIATRIEQNGDAVVCYATSAENEWLEDEIVLRGPPKM
jgi:hypothetical protein